LVAPTSSAAGSGEIRWLGAAVQWRMDATPREAAGAGLPLLLCDPTTGEAKQRLALRPESPRLHADLRPGPEWALAPRSAPGPGATAPPRAGNFPRSRPELRPRTVGLRVRHQTVTPSGNFQEPIFNIQ